METQTPASAKKSHRITVKPRKPDVKAVLTSLREMVRCYTRHHEAIEVEHALMSSNFAISLRAHMDDQGKLVGGGGSNIWSLKLIFKVMGLRMDKRLQITLLKPAQGQQDPLTAFAPDPNFDHRPTAEMLSRVLSLMVAAPTLLNVADVGEETHYEVVPTGQDLVLFRGDVTSAFRNLLIAIGKSQGRRMVFHLADPEAVADLPALAPEPEITATPDLPHSAAPDAPDESGPVDAIEEEAIRRGFVKK